MADVGRIEVKFIRKGNATQAPRPTEDYSNFGLSEIHEKALKGQPKYHSVS